MPLKGQKMEIDKDEPGLQDSTVSDFLLPYLMGKMPVAQGAEAAAPVAEDAAGTQMRELLKQSMSEPAMPHMEGGGLVDDFTVDGGDSDTVKGLPINPPPETAAAPAMPIDTPKPAPIVAPSALTEKAVNPRPMPGMPADVTPDQLKSYLDAQRGAIGKYSPDRQFEAEQANLRGRTGVVGNLANAGATFADALMQGVAGKGNPGFASQLNQRQNELATQSTEALERARKGSMEKVEAEQKIDMNDPTAPLSKAAQSAYGPTLISMGATKEQVARMPASLISDVANKNVTLTEALARIQQEGTYQKGMLANTAAQREQQAEEFKTQHPILSRLSGFRGSSASGATPPPASAGWKYVGKVKQP